MSECIYCHGDKVNALGHTCIDCAGTGKLCPYCYSSFEYCECGPQYCEDCKEPVVICKC